MSEGRTRYWRATLNDEQIEAEGLEVMLEAIQRKWGGKAVPVATVRNALTIGSGNALLATEAGLVTLMRDNELGKQRAVAEAQDSDIDGRVRTFHGIYTLVHHDKDGGSVVAEERHSADGLMRLIERCVGRTHALLGGVPLCMSKDECYAREAAWRVQISRGKGKTTINFPSVNDGHEFLVAGKPYSVMLRILPELPQERQPDKVERLSFARKG